MLGGQREWNSGLDQIVAHRNLATERIAASRRGEFVQLIRIRLHQHGNFQIRYLQRICDPLFIAKIGKHHQDAVNFVAVLFKQIGAPSRLGMSFNATQLRLFSR